MTHNEKVLKYVSEAAVYVPGVDLEAMRINHYDAENNVFYVTGEESGDEYRVQFSDVNLSEDSFYKLVLM